MTDTSVLSTLLMILTAIAIYLVAVSRARFRTITVLQKRFGTTPEEFKNIGYEDAQTVITHLYFFEVPWMFLLAQNFAILRTLGLEEITKVSKGKADTGRKYSNTNALGAEWLVNPLDSARSMTAINRVNYIHSRYQGIDNAPMLFTICCLMCDVIEWIDRYEYRKTVPLERHAAYVFWKELGIRFGIKESTIPDSFEACSQFVKIYEDEEMRTNEYSAKVAQGVIGMYQATLPKFLRPLFTNIFIYLLDEHLRDVFLLTLDRKSHFIGTLTTRIFPLALKLRAKFVRYCLLPRRHPPTAFVSAKDGIHTHVGVWTMMPYYAEATWWSKWGPWALCRRALGLPIPGKEWIDQGYKIEEIGFGGRGGDKVLGVVNRGTQGGCPFSTFGRVEDEQDLGGVYAKFNASGCVHGD